MGPQNSTPQDPNLQVHTPNMPKKTPKKLLLVALVMLLLGGTGGGVWYWQQQKLDDQKSKVTQLEAENQTLKTAQASPNVASFVKYVNQTGDFSISYPPAWLALVCEGNLGTVFLAPDEESQALCASEKFSPVSVTSNSGDQRSLSLAEIKKYASQVELTNVTIDGVAGKKATYTHSGNEFVTKGTKYIQYEFFTNKRTYTASYGQEPTGDDLSADFEAMIKTLKFSIE